MTTTSDSSVVEPKQGPDGHRVEITDIFGRRSGTPLRADPPRKPTVVYTTHDGRTRVVRTPASVPMNVVFEHDYQLYVVEQRTEWDAMGVAQWRAITTSAPSSVLFPILVELLDRGLLAS